MKRNTCMTMLLTVAAVGLMAEAANAGDLTFEFLRITDTNTSPPGRPEFLFHEFRDASVDDQGNVAFQGGFNDGLTIHDGVFRWGGNVLSRIMDEQTPVPTIGVTLTQVDDHVEIRDGVTVFYGDAGDGNDMIATSDGITGHIVAHEGVTTLPSAGNPLVNSIFNAEDFGFDGVRTAFFALFGDSFDNRGVYVEDGLGTITKLADTSDSAPAPNNETFTGFGDPMPDANGPGVVFMGFTTNSDGVYVSDGGAVSKIADNLTDFPPINSDILAVSFSEPDIDGGKVAFRVSQVECCPTVYVEQQVVMFDGNALITIADLTTVLPGGETATRFENVLISNGTVAFRAQTASGRRMLLWRDGTLHEVLAEGDLIDGQTVASVQTGYERGFLADGYLSLDLGFTDGSDAVYRVAIGENLCPADLDGNGAVDIIDLMQVLGAWGTAGGDTDGDGLTNVFDLLAVLSSWGSC